ncbi:MAG: dockerin type I domain-containing protein [Rubripirellula sp.]
MTKPNRIRPLSFQQLQERQLFAGDVASTANDVPAGAEPALTEESEFSVATNAEIVTEPDFDVNDDGVVSALDALMVINAMNQIDQPNRVEGEQITDDVACDINLDGNVSARDALMIINEMNRMEQERRGGGCSCGGVGCPACGGPASSINETAPVDGPITFTITSTEEIVNGSAGGCGCGGIGCAACV